MTARDNGAPPNMFTSSGDTAFGHTPLLFILQNYAISLTMANKNREKPPWF
jgi:hypothetical protein